MVLSDTNNSLRKNKGASHIGGALTLTLSAIILKMLGFIYKIPLSSLLGDQGMGYFNTAYTVFSVFYLLCTAGVPKAVTMLVAEAEERRINGEEKRILSVALLFFFIISILISGLFILFAGSISSFLGTEKSKYTLIAIAPSIIPVALGSALRGYLGAKLKLGAIAVSQIIDGVGKLAFGLVFAHMASDAGCSAEIISAYTILGVSIGAVGSLIYLAIIQKTYKHVNKLWQNNNVSDRKTILKKILLISVPITLSSFVMSLCNLIDLGMIMRALKGIGYSEEEATKIFGNYTTLAVPMYNFVVSLIAPISIAFLPLAKKAFVNLDISAVNKSIKSSLSLTAFMSAPMVLGLFVFSKEVLGLIFPSSDIGLGAPLLSLLIPAGMVMPIILIVNSTLEARGRVMAPLISMLIGSAVKIIVGGVLLSNKNLGIAGAPIGTVLSYIVALFVSLFILNRERDIRVPVVSTHIVPYLNAFISVVIAKSINDEYLCQLSASLSLAIVIVLCAFIYLILSFITGVLSFIKSENRHIRQKSRA